MARGKAAEIILTDREREELGQRVRRRKIGRADAMRAEIVLLAADGLDNCAIAEELGISRLLYPATSAARMAVSRRSTRSAAKTALPDKSGTA